MQSSTKKKCNNLSEKKKGLGRRGRERERVKGKVREQVSKLYAIFL